jgi:adenylate kinase
MFRAAMDAGTDIGRQVEPILARGELVPDELTVGLIRERLLSNAAKGFVLDGFPRNEAQSDALDELLSELDRGLDAILFFDLADDVATDRMLGRAGEEHRTDDTPEAIAHRLSIYHAKTEPVVEHYRVTGKLVPLHAERSADEVWLEIQQALDQVNGRGPR